MELTGLLGYIPPASLTYQEWVSVGMALKHEGRPCSEWDAWSRADKRYKRGECEKKWETFNEDTGEIVTGGTIYELATRNGYSPQGEVKLYDWDDEITYDGPPRVGEVIRDPGWLDTSGGIEEPDVVGSADLKRFIEILFKPHEIVGFCTDAYEDDGKWKPASRGSYGFTAERLIRDLEKHPGDIESSFIGMYNHEAGAWIRFNPLDGEGVKNSNVTALRYALVESDTLDIERQKAIMEELRLPIAVMTHSGGKSVHAIVRVDASDMGEYKSRVDYLYEVCDKNGLKVDKQNKNPSRLTRMPGVTRGDHKQFIIAENVGEESYDAWKTYIEDASDTLPEIIDYASLDTLPPLAPEVIGGVLRRRHKMLIAGPSKAGKSFLLIELALTVATGRRWLGEFQCACGKVLYINMEVDGASFLHRVNAVQERMGIKERPKGLSIWNMRGNNVSLSSIVPILARRIKGKDISMVIVDPFYKLNQADENSAHEMAMAFSHLDRICTENNVAVILCHHHSKGAQGHKFAWDRASGSGVFARDPDAVLDMIQLNPKDAEVSLAEGATAWRVSFTLREFRSPDDIDLIFEYPTHYVSEDLEDAKPIGGQDAKTNSERGAKQAHDDKEARYKMIVDLVENWELNDPKEEKTPHPTAKEIARHFKERNVTGLTSDKTIMQQIEDHEDYYLLGKYIVPKGK